MNKTAAGGGVVASGPCPDFEILASFVDANLTAAERTHVVEHLADCPKCAEVVAETMRLLGDVGLDEEADEEADENEEAGPGDSAPALKPSGRVIPFRRWVAVAVPLAAAAALAVAIWPPGFEEKSWVGGEMARRARGDRGWLAGLGGGLPNFRGVEESSEAAFRVGVVTVDLAAALARGDREASAEFAARAGLELSDGMWGDARTAASYRDLGNRLGEGLPMDEASVQAAALEEQARKALGADAEFSLGKWAEAGRLAAKLGNVRYFTEPQTRRQARDLARSELPERLDERLAAVREQLTEDDPDLTALESALDQLIRTGRQ
jgi:hypothetical protein